MKKIFGIVLLTAMSLSFLIAQEEESSFGKPSFSLENELVIKGERLGEDTNKGNFQPAEDDFIANSTTAKFAVGFNIGENFSLKPYIKDSVTFGVSDWKKGISPSFSANKFSLGIGGTYKPLDMLSIMFGLGYDSKYGKFVVVKGSDTPPTPPKFTSVGNGFNFNVGVGLSVESIFLEAGVGYKVDGMFASYREKDDYYTSNAFTNKITLEATFDFFNFIKEGLNSGLVFENTTKFKSNWINKGSDQLEGKKVISNDFGIGLHFAPVEYMDAKFLTTVAFEQTNKYDSAKKSYEIAEKSVVVGLTLGLEFSKDMFKIGVEYNPALSKKAGKDKLEEDKTLEHEFKFVLGVSL
ncbi:MAG: hypothetical protein ACTTKH_06270 [Treponema sp.]